MSELDVFFQRKARSFTLGQMALFEDVMDYPCIVGMGVRQVTFDNQIQLHEAMRSYRRSLMDKGYSYTSITTEYEKLLVDGMTYALVNIGHFDNNGVEISCLPASYFVDIQELDAPVVRKVEFLEDPYLS